MAMKDQWALVVEGGAMRGIFSAGVLDAFLELDYQPFDLCVGVSAGSTNIAAFLAKMPKRNYKIYTTYSRDPRFVNLWRFIRGGHLMELDWLWEKTIATMRLNLDQIISSSATYVVGLTDVHTGEVVYKTPTKENLENMIKASSAVPIFYKHPVMVDGHPYLDGGLSAPIPILEAVRRGANRIVVMRSRKLDYIMPPNKSPLPKLMLKAYPALIEAIQQRHNVYNQQVDYLRQSHQGIEIIEVCPPESFMTSRLTRDIEVLKTDYRLGLVEGRRLVKKLKKDTNDYLC